MAKKIFWLNCPFDEKDMCKNLGGRWDNDRNHPIEAACRISSF